MTIPLKEITEEDRRKYSNDGRVVTFFDVCVRGTHLPVKLGCPFHLGNVIRCFDHALNCRVCLKMYAYCKNLTGVGRV